MLQGARAVSIHLILLVSAWMGYRCMLSTGASSEACVWVLHAKAMPWQVEAAMLQGSWSIALMRGCTVPQRLGFGSMAPA